LTNEIVGNVQEKTTSVLSTHSYDPFKIAGLYLYAKNLSGQFDHEIGDVRVTFNKVPCGPTSIIAQQTQTGNGFSLRQWNPLKINVPVGMNNDAEDSGCGICNAIPCCFCIDKCFASMFKETVEWVYT
jgi:hypothetical protein